MRASCCSGYCCLLMLYVVVQVDLHCLVNVAVGTTVGCVGSWHGTQYLHVALHSSVHVREIPFPWTRSKYSVALAFAHPLDFDAAVLI